MNNIKINLIFQTLYQVLIIITPLITSPYVSRILGAEGLGIYSYTYSIVNYLMIFAMLGTNTYGSRSIAVVKDDRKKRSLVFSEIFCLQSILTIISCLMYIIYLIMLPIENKIIAFIQLILLISCLFNINWFFFGMEEFKLTVSRNIFIKVTTILAIFTFVKNENDLWKYVLILAIGELGSQLMLFNFIKKYIDFVIPTIYGIVRHIKPNLILFIPAIAFSINNLFDKTMLGYFSGYSSTGMYYNAEKIINIPMGVITGIGVVMLPRISNLISNGKGNESNEYLYKTIFFINILSIAMAFGISAISKDFIPLFLGNGFEHSILLVMIMSPLIIIRANSNVIRTQYLIPHKLDKVYSKAMLMGAVFNLLLNCVCIRKYGAIGAAIATVISEAIVNIYQNNIAQKYISVKDKILKTNIFILSGIGMFFIVRLVSKTTMIHSILIKLLIEIIIGIIAYTGISIMIIAIFYKDEFKHFIIKNKIKS